MHSLIKRARRNYLWRAHAHVPLPVALLGVLASFAALWPIAHAIDVRHPELIGTTPGYIGGAVASVTMIATIHGVMTLLRLVYVDRAFAQASTPSAG